MAHRLGRLAFEPGGKIRTGMTESKALAEPTTVAGYTDAIARALEAAGVDPEKVLREAHVDRVCSNDPMVRITDSDINAIYERAVAATGDPYFGLRVAQYILPGMMHALGYALLASDTLEDFCKRAVRYWALVAQGVDITLVNHGGELALLISDLAPASFGLCYAAQDVWAALVLRLMRMVRHDELRPLRVKCLRPMPTEGDGPYREIFGCPVLFEQDCMGLYFDLDIMREPLAGASRELAQHNDQITLGYLEKLNRGDIVNRVRAHIVSGLSGGSFSRAAIAASVNMSASTLQTRLARAGLSYQQLLDETRHELALGYIEQSRLSITEIAFMLGFADLSNFIRAFRRWTGKSPTGFRRRGK
jgi:AraC-like DNA-binding protein